MLSHLTYVWLFVTLWTVAHQAPLSMGFSMDRNTGKNTNTRQEYWRGLPFHSPGDLPNPGIESESSASPELTGRFFTVEPLRKPDNAGYQVKFEFQIKIIVFSINVS